MFGWVAQPGVLPWVALVFGLCVGSFLNVVIWRVPRKQSVVRPASHCPQCETPIQPADNIPVVSWLLLRGKCRACGHPIPVRYPLVELVTALLGAEAPDDLATELADYLRQEHPEVDLVVYRGGQTDAVVVLGVE